MLCSRAVIDRHGTEALTVCQTSWIDLCIQMVDVHFTNAECEYGYSLEDAQRCSLRRHLCFAEAHERSISPNSPTIDHHSCIPRVLGRKPTHSQHLSSGHRIVHPVQVFWISKSPGSSLNMGFSILTSKICSTRNPFSRAKSKNPRSLCRSHGR